MTRPALIPLVCAAALTCGTAQAATASWTSHGPYGGRITALLVDPTTPGTVYAATSEGKAIFKSTDGALSWLQSSDGLTPRAKAQVLSLALDPSDADTLYAGFLGVQKSTDGGRTWSPTGSRSGIVYSLAVDPEAPDVVYAGLGQSARNSEGEPFFPEGVLKSVDGGGQWTVRSQGLPSTNVTTLLIDPSDSAILYAGTASRGVYKSTDGAESWSPASFGLRSPEGFEARFVYSLVMDPTSPDTLYAGTERGLFKTTDDAATWNRVFVQIFSPSIEAVAIDPVTPTTVFAATQDGLFQSTDSGGHWALRSDELEAWEIGTLTVDPHDPSVLYAGTHGGGVFRSANGGGQWGLASAGLRDASVEAIAIHPHDSSVAYAGVDGGGVARTADSGDSWQLSSDRLSQTVVQALAIDPVTPTTVYAGTQDGVAKSTDGGATWVNFPLERGIRSLAIDPESPATVYAGFGLSSSAEVVKTTNGGSSWRTASTGLQCSLVGSLAIDPSTPTTLYAACSGSGGSGLFKSTDAAGTWRRLETGLTESLFSSVVVDPVASQTVYAAGRGKVFKSVNGGDTWSLASDGLPDGPLGEVTLAIDPVDPHNLYAAMFAGVFRSSDGGSSWRFLGLADRAGAPVAVDPDDPDVVYAGGLGGVFRLVQEGGPTAEPPPPEPPLTTYLTSSEIPGFRFKVRLSTGAQLVAGRQEGACLGETLCVSGALVGRSELFLRMIGPRPNRFLWLTLVRFTPSRVEVWAEQTGTGRINYYDLPALPPDDDELSGLLDRAAFTSEGSPPASEPLARSRPPSSSGVELVEARGLALTDAPVIGGAAPVTFTSDAFPGYEFEVRIVAGGEEQAMRVESECLPETVCVSGALPGRSELFLRIIGPRPNGFLWTNLVRFTTSRVEVELEQLATGETKTYVLEEVARQSDQLPGRVDREAFLP